MKTQKQIDRYRKTHTTEEVMEWLTENIEKSIETMTGNDPFYHEMHEIKEAISEIYKIPDVAVQQSKMIDLNHEITKLRILIRRAKMDEDIKKVNLEYLNRIGLEMAKDILGIDFSNPLKWKAIRIRKKKKP
jgi:hypothetical protein